MFHWSELTALCLKPHQHIAYSAKRHGWYIALTSQYLYTYFVRSVLEWKFGLYSDLLIKDLTTGMFHERFPKKMKVQLLVVSLRLVYRNDFGACHGAPNSSISRSKSLLVTSSSKGVRRLFILQDPSKSLHSILWETALYVETPGQVPMISVLWKKTKNEKTLFDLYTLKINWALKNVHHHLANSLVFVDGAQYLVRSPCTGLVLFPMVL